MLPVKREDVVAAWTFRTMSITEELTRLRALPWSILKGVDGNHPSWKGTFEASLASLPGWASKTNLGGWVPDGSFTSFWPSTSGLTHAFLRDPTQGKVIPAVPFILTVPKGAAPAKGWPVVLFQHGTYASKSAALLMADRLAAAGYATLAFDVIYHGDRSWCTRDTHCVAPGTCDVQTGQCTTPSSSWTGRTDNPLASGSASSTRPTTPSPSGTTFVSTSSVPPRCCGAWR